MGSYSVSLVLSDPPYNISVNASNHMENTDWDKFASDEDYKDFMVRYLKECSRILKDDGAVIIFFSHSKIKVMLEIFKESGLHPDFKFWKSICRQKGAGAKHKLKSQREDFILLSKEKTFRYNNVDNLFNYDNGNVTNILNAYNILFTDGVNANRLARDYKRTLQSVDSKMKMKLHLAPGGGAALKITRK